MYIPSSTYRIQLNSYFHFSELEKLIDYLDQLGIDTIYAAPFLQSTKGSMHGYDVTNPEAINPELETERKFDELISILKKRNIGWLQDIVPNHMAYNSENIWLMDVFEKGPDSKYFDFFDINWKDVQITNKVLFPFLKDSQEGWVKENSISIEYKNDGFFIKINKASYPASWISYHVILSEIPFGMNESWYSTFQQIKENFQYSQEYEIFIYLKESLYKFYNADSNFRDFIVKGIKAINKDSRALDEILKNQFFKPTSFTITDTKINYRRFFIVNELICLKMENEKTFETYHFLIKKMLQKGLIQGLRIDHIDGLCDPAKYLTQLRNMAGNNIYLVGEKILGANEDIPLEWPIQGTSGYDFLGIINQLFVNKNNEKIFSDVYNKFIDDSHQYEEIVFEKKRMMISEKMLGEMDNLLEILYQNELDINVDTTKLKEALIILMASFPVYRTYATEFIFSQNDKENISIAFEKAVKKGENLEKELTYLRNILMQTEVEDSGVRKGKLKFLMRFQQFTGPIAAKGTEDTAFYIFNRLISLNEVGDTPCIFGISTNTFHQFMIKRQKIMPFSLNTTSTHDTKRGEDARIRISLLSSMPDEWERIVHCWADNNKKYKKHDSYENEIPCRNDEYFIYQSLIGGFSEEEEQNRFLKRFQDFMTKAMREAKVYTHAENPIVEYEQGTLDFIKAILKDTSFMKMFVEFLNKVIHYSIPHSLGQTLIKITAPGIPDTYQGTELWDLSFVDPDNRRSIDFDKRKQILHEILTLKESDRLKYLKEIIESKTDGRVKFFTTWLLLTERRKTPSLFTLGEYIPLSFLGKNQDTLIGYARYYQEEWCLVITIKDSYSLNYKNSLPVKEDLWKDCKVFIPENAPQNWKNIFTNQFYETINLKEENSEASEFLMVNDVLNDFPVALLKKQISN
jgi:(1->4)-alpha-D-glucan 1-alpha-D-glucosylmutase